MAEMKKYKIAPGQKHFMRGKGKGNVCFTAGQVVELYPHQAKPIRDKLLPMEETAAELQDVAEKILPEYTVSHVGSGKYNVYNSVTKKAENESPLSKAAAEALAKKLNGSEG